MEERRRQHNINMSEETETVDTCCCSCGIAEIDDMKLVPCDGCDLVRYCSDQCREEHRPEHGEECKKRATELRDELLFKQPESNYLGDCPICSLPMPIDEEKSSIYECCSKLICDGCVFANMTREKEMRLTPSCPFCRTALPETDEEYDKQLMKRVEANDPAALRRQGMVEQHEKGDYRSAFDYFAKAAALGDAWAHFNLARLYHDGEGVEKDEGKYIRHLEEAAIGGHPNARCLLAIFERKRGNTERSVKHYIIAASQGQDGSMQMLMELFKHGYVEKEVLAAALRAHKAAVDATKSRERELEERISSGTLLDWLDDD